MHTRTDWLSLDCLENAIDTLFRIAVALLLEFVAMCCLVV